MESLYVFKNNVLNNIFTHFSKKRLNNLLVLIIKLKEKLKKKKFLFILSLFIIKKIVITNEGANGKNTNN